jgi:hypothetical protein
VTRTLQDRLDDAAQMAADAVALSAEHAGRADSAEARIAELGERWQALKDWLADEITHDHSVMESFADYPDGGVTSKAHGALASAKRSVLARMRELEQ